MIDGARWRVEPGRVLNVEESLPAQAVQSLRGMGHDIVVADRFSTDFGRAQIILKTEGGYVGASEWRTDGQAVGF
jgi:gamma-glutamyltranspeptidase/glutathione hydrolase